MKKFFAVACVASLMSGPAQAVAPTNITEAIQYIQSDSVLLSGWLSREFKHAIPFNSTSGNVVPSQFKLFGIGFGVSAVVSSTKPDNDGLHRLPTSVVNTGDIDTFDRLPLPMILAHAKLGLPFGMDAGVRVGGIPSTDSDEGDTHMEVSNTVFGLDVRKKLIEEGVAKPFGLTVGINYTHAKGHVTASTPYTPNVGSDVTFSADSRGTARADWETDSVGAQVLVNKKILFMNPYLGASINKNYGDIKTGILNSGTATYVPGATSQTFSTLGEASEKVDDTDIRGLLGLEFTFLPFCKLTLGGELANRGKASANLGLRFQFR